MSAEIGAEDGPFWNERGEQIMTADLPLPGELGRRIYEWALRGWESDDLHEAGRPLYDEVKQHLAEDYEVIWGED